MRQVFTTGLLWFSAIGCGLMAGIYFAFSTFIMTAFDRLDQAAGIAAMNAINVDIVRSLFMPLFLGTTVAGAALVVMGALRVSEPGAVSMIAGGGLYVSVPKHVESNESVVIQGERPDSMGTRRQCGLPRTVHATTAAACAIRAT
ncbi:hypothetical protein J4G48_0029220 [Bradyrhizobium barranii subsp. apii]|uniref:anthrone oxygenase family protein n=1 Tax=Bradyrhizobium barranii TaxID=2992140 RepID=UPI001CD612DE|nr:hypothetical protein [Bradyrhizobium barranii]UPT93439.1 hypothetical protein J4G48_0029220 [Bradyrhizobium barranii subsp. apii]